MSKSLNHRERLEKVLAGEKPDRIPVAFWRHFPVDDQRPERLAKAIIEYQKQNEFDFVKVTPASSFCLFDYGIRDEWKGNPEGTREYVIPFIKGPKEFNKIHLLSPKFGRLGDQIKCLSMIKDALPESTPFIQTIFSPLAQLKNMVGRTNLPYFIRRYPDETRSILQIITESTKQFIHECKKTSMDGIFYAVQAASYDQLSESEYLTFGKPFDLEILFESQDLWLNVLHIHGTNIMFDLVKDYPCQIINWHDRETSPSLKEAQIFSDKITCGGLRRIETMVLGLREDIEKEILDAVEQTNGIRFILSTGCVLMLTTPQGNIESVREIVNSITL
jgi:uroporphyrinogen decarboxylase